VKAYETSFALQCRYYRNKNIDAPFELELDVFFKNKAADLDGSFKVILDCLQHVNAIKNDKFCMKIVANKYVDTKNPRIEFSLKKL
jgi:Holliday junction resolvase RusA-like endonuclease